MRQTIRVPEYAGAKKVSPMQIRNWVHRGIIPAIIIGRTILLDPEECDRALEQFKRGGRPKGSSQRKATVAS